MDIRDVMGTRLLFFDGGMGSMFQKLGARPGENTDIWNLTKPDIVTDIHRQYLQAGANIILSNTFGANGLKLAGSGYTVERVVTRGVELARAAADNFCREKGLRPEDRPIFTALDVAPTGKLLQPLGDLSFDGAYALFREIVVAGTRAGADLIQIETMADTYELKAAVLAAKENSDLPVFATATFDASGKLLTGANPEALVALLEGLGVDALGVNCGLGPFQLEEVVDRLLAVSSIPVIVTPNAGLPHQENGETVYDVGPADFAEKMRSYAEEGVWLLGGCCGTTPAHIEAMTRACRDIAPKPIADKARTVVSSSTHAVAAGTRPLLIGERINPTGKARLKQALREGDMDFLLGEGFTQQENGAHILDVNVGLPGLDEAAVMRRVVEEVQSVIDLPLCIDTADAAVMEQALRYYNGKALINSVSGKRASMEKVFPLARRYGGVVIGLTLDEDGIPETAEGRLAVAQKIVETAASYGIPKKDIVIDVLCMTVSSDARSAVTTLRALRLVREKLGVRTSLGVSNISFGLPRRDLINRTFYTMALTEGLDYAIMNPNADGMMESYRAYEALAGLDENCERFIEAYAGTAAPAGGAGQVSTDGSRPGAGHGQTGSAGNGRQAAENGADAEEADGARAALERALQQAIGRGRKEQAGQLADALLADMDPMVLIDRHLIPALDAVGQGYEQGRVFLPQLLMSAEAAKAAFEAVRSKLAATGGQARKGKVLIATVQGDIHDIGKNIVKVLLENYGYDVLDLGRDVAPETVAEAAVSGEIRLVGLSALMTTTVGSMEETIRLLRQRMPDCHIMVGGAVLTESYAMSIGADRYVKDAMASVHYAQEVVG